jgi:transposase
VSWSAAHKHFLRWCRAGTPPQAGGTPRTKVLTAIRGAPTIAHVWVDKGCTGSTVADAAAKAGVTVDVVSGPKPGRGFTVQPRRWVVERTNGWINHCRRLDRHYEVTLDAHEGFLILSQIALLLRRLDGSQLFDTH